MPMFSEAYFIQRLDRYHHKRVFFETPQQEYSHIYIYDKVNRQEAQSVVRLEEDNKTENLATKNTNAVEFLANPDPILARDLNYANNCLSRSTQTTACRVRFPSAASVSGRSSSSFFPGCPGFLPQSPTSPILNSSLSLLPSYPFSFYQPFCPA